MPCMRGICCYTQDVPSHAAHSCAARATLAAHALRTFRAFLASLLSVLVWRDVRAARIATPPCDASSNPAPRCMWARWPTAPEVCQSVRQSVIRRAARGQEWLDAPFDTRHWGHVQVWLLHGGRPHAEKHYFLLQKPIHVSVYLLASHTC